MSRDTINMVLDDPFEDSDWVECWQCSGEGRLPGCYQDTCVCGGEDDADTCCAPQTCEVCDGAGGWAKPTTEEIP